MRNRKSWLVVVLGVGAALFFASRWLDIKKSVDERFPPIDPVRAQLAATEAASKHLVALEKPNVYIALATQDLATQLPKAFVVPLGATGTKNAARISNVVIELGRQELVVRGDADVVFDDQQSHAMGTFEVHCAAAVENSALVLRPVATGLHVTQLKYGRATKLILDVARPLINAAAKDFLDNLSGIIGAQVIPIAFGVEHKVDLKAELDAAVKKALEEQAAVGGTLKELKVTALEASTVHVHTALGRTAVLIDPDGIHVLGELVSLVPPTFEQAHKQLKARIAAGTQTPFSSAELAYLAGCPSNPDDPALPEPKDAQQVEYRGVCRALRPQTLAAAPTPSGGELGQVQQRFDAAFAAFAVAMREKAVLVEAPKNLLWTATAVAVSRAAFTDILNGALAQVAVSADVAVPHQTVNINETIYTSDAPDLKCSENAGGCQSSFQAPAHSAPSCNESRDCRTGCRQICLPANLGCHEACGGIDLGCAKANGDCKASKLAYELQHAADVSRAFTAWNLERAACVIKREAKKKGCEVNQGWLNQVSHKDVGGVSGNVSAGDATLRLTIGQVSLAPGFAGLRARFFASAQAEVSANLKVVPHNALNLACFKEFPLNIDADVNVSLSEQQISLVMQEVKAAESGLVFTFSTSDFDVEVKTDPPLVRALLERNAATLITSCPAPVAIVSAIAAALGTTPVAIPAAIKLEQAVNMPTRRIHVDSNTFSFTVPTLEIKIGEDQDKKPIMLRIAPAWYDSSIVFYKK